MTQSLHALLQPVTDTAILSEDAFFRIWQQCLVPGQSPFALAVSSGLAADRFAWIFAAGYQSAMRHVFAGVFDRVDIPRWCAFAVSEDRSPQNPLPGLDWCRDGENYVISGYKTWVAGSRHLSHLIIKAGRGERARYLLLPEGMPGMRLTHKAAPRLLPDLSQGVAEFVDLRCGAAALVDAGAVKFFAATEVLYIYTAFLASIWGRVAAERSAVEDGLQQAMDISATATVTREGAMRDLDALVQALLVRLGNGPFADNPDWQRDRKLIEMYRMDH